VEHELAVLQHFKEVHEEIEDTNALKRRWKWERGGPRAFKFTVGNIHAIFTGENNIPEL